MPGSPKNQPDDIKLAAESALMAGKKGLIMGVANERSIAWNISKLVHQHGAELAFSYQGDALLKRVTPLATGIDSDIILPCDVTNEASIDAVFKLVFDVEGF